VTPEVSYGFKNHFCEPSAWSSPVDILYLISSRQEIFLVIFCSILDEAIGEKIGDGEYIKLGSIYNLFLYKEDVGKAADEEQSSTGESESESLVQLDDCKVGWNWRTK